MLPCGILVHLPHLGLFINRAASGYNAHAVEVTTACCRPLLVYLPDKYLLYWQGYQQRSSTLSSIDNILYLLLHGGQAERVTYGLYGNSSQLRGSHVVRRDRSMQ